MTHTNKKPSTIGIDLAKRIFHIHGVDKNGKPVLKKKIDEEQIVRFYGKSTQMPSWYGSLRRF